MLTEEEIEMITKHGMSHEINYCKCPCFDALLRLGNQAKALNDLMGVGTASFDTPMGLEDDRAGEDPEC